MIPAPYDPDVDSIGYVKELERKYSNDLIAIVKARMMDAGEKRRAGEAFEAVLATGDVETIDADLFLGLLECGTLTRAQFLSCIAVRKEPAGQYLGGEIISAMSHKAPKPPALYVNRRKGVELTLVQAVQKLAGTFNR